MIGEIARKAIEDKKDVIIDLATKIWQNPELAFGEHKACRWTAEVLKDEGFDVEVGYAGMPTAIRAVWGSGKPVIGLLGEYDALPGLSQKLSTVQEPEACDVGHGCGHNLLGAAHVAAAIGAKKEMEERSLSGTIVFYGCPAEERVVGKGYMAREGAFRELDVAFAYHPASSYMFTIGTMAALNTAKFHFKGKTAHAGGDPHNGRSALDAAELMNVGANFLREHLPDIVRLHYTYTEVPAVPNIVPDRATVWYYVRAKSREMVEEAYARLIKVAQGAAMMTETEVEVEYMGGCYNTLSNKLVTQLLRDTAAELPELDWSEGELKFAKALNDNSELFRKSVASGELDGNIHLESAVPSELEMKNSFGSTDVGDVSHIVPCTMFSVPSSNLGAGGHTWQVTASSGSSIGMKGMLRAGEIMAVSAIKIFEDPSIADSAKEEFKASMGSKTYVCPIPKDAPVPVIQGE